MPSPREINPEILKYATARQRADIEAVLEHGSIQKAARALGKSHTTVSGSIQAAERKMDPGERTRFPGYDRDVTLDDSPIAEPWRLGKVTIQRTDSGIERVWERHSPDENNRFEIIKQYIEDKLSGIPPVDPILAPSGPVSERLCNVYTMTDCHIGMLAWGRETGAPWDLKIAAATLKGCFKAMLDQSPAARVGIVNQLGDWLHVDKVEPFTPASGHILDADIRFPKIVSAGLDVFEWLIVESLKKHEIVHVVCAEGNHDPVSAIWMRLHLQRLFRDNPRVTVNDSETPYYVYQHGKTMLAFHHGHKKKLAELPLLFASRWPDIWGSTTKRYGHSGHMHHEKELKAEFSGMKWLQHPTLSAPDSYAARGGWDSMREATAITYSDKHGQVSSVTVNPDMLAD